MKLHTTMENGTIHNVQFTETEKKAIFVMSNEVILADGKVHPSELAEMKELQEGIGMSPNLVNEAKETSTDEALVALHNMSYPKKKILAQILEDMAISDNHLHENEMQLIIQTFKNIGIGGETE
ncbi:TerB family tellurite resistance protein [Zobellia russellii]|uniref:TerB family tellurite resistance protein n=1 Tax=Zobellia russellii TaxID=248907 RepID=UPI0037DD2DA3